MKKLITILFFLITTLTYAQNRIYVSTSGDNANDGLDSINAVQTLSYAQSIASAGDTICLKKGDTWTLTSQFAFTLSGLSNALRTIWDGRVWGPGSDTATIRNNVGGGEIYPIVISNVRYLTIQNIIYDGNNIVGNGFHIGGNSNNDEHDITIQNCEIKNLGTTGDYAIGILCRPCLTDIYNIVLTNNYIHHVASHGIALYTCTSAQVGDPAVGIDSLIVISHNTIEDYQRNTGNSGAGILINNAADSIIIEYNHINKSTVNGQDNINIGSNEPVDGYFPINTIIRYNYIENPTTTWTSAGIKLQGGQAITTKVYGNIIDIDGSASGGIEVQSGRDWTGSYLEIYNNTILHSSSTNALANSSTVTNTVSFKNNILYNDGTTYCIYNPTSASLIHNNNSYYRTVAGDPDYITIGGSQIAESDMPTWEPTSEVGDPTFVTDFTDLHLQAGSPAIGAGTNVGVTLDYDGETFSVSTPAIGAYEYIDAGVTAPAVVGSAASADWTRKGDAGGNVTSDGGGTVTARGVCWKTSTGPTTSDSFTTDGTGTGTYTSILRPLVAGTTYYVRAYATNATGTSYGDEYSFTTPEYSILMNGTEVQVSGGKIVIIK